MARVIFLLTEEKTFQKSTNQKQELPVVAMFVNRSGQNGFREDFFKSANQKQELPVATMNGSGQNQQSLQRTFHRCFLPSFSSFGGGISDGRRTPSNGKRSHFLWQGELKTKKMSIMDPTIKRIKNKYRSIYHQPCKVHFHISHLRLFDLLINLYFLALLNCNLIFFYILNAF